MLSTVAYALPLPLSVFVRPNPAAECETVLGFLHIAIGLLAPLVFEALAETRLFQKQQQRRKALGLPRESGAEAAIFNAIGFLLEEGTMIGFVAFMLLLLAVTWDWVALFSVPVEHRTWRDQ